MPSEAIISGYKGKIDFYVWKGLAVARRWPRKKRYPPTPQEKSQWPVFSDAVAEWNNLSPTVRQAYITMASGSTLSGRDMMIKMYINASKILPY